MLQPKDNPPNSFYTSIHNREILVNNILTPNNFIYKEIFEYNVYNSIPEMKINYGDIVIDVGAHIGIFSRYSAIQGADKIIAFEMNPSLFSCLRLNVREQDDIFNCVLLDKNLYKFKLENEILVNGFDLNHFYEGKLFKYVDFLKIDIMGKELNLLKSINKKVYNVINKVSVKLYNVPDNKKYLIEFMKENGFYKHHLVMIPNQTIEFLYFWK